MNMQFYITGALATRTRYIGSLPAIKPIEKVTYQPYAAGQGKGASLLPPKRAHPDEVCMFLTAIAEFD